MNGRRVARRAFLWGLTVLAGPCVGVLLILVIAGQLALGPAVLAALAIMIVIAIPLRRHFLSLGGFVDGLAALEEGGAPERLHLDSPLVSRPLAILLADATAAQRTKLKDLAARSASSETLLANLPDPIIAITADRRIIRTTQGATTLPGVDPAGADLAAALRDPAVLEAAARVIDTGEPEDVDFSPSGTDVALAARIVALPRSAPDGTRALIAIRDVTALRSGERMRADFIANASHELRTPISVLLGCIQTLRGPAQDDSDAQARFLAMMDEQAERMSRLVGDLLSLSKIELNEHQPPSEVIALQPVIGHVVDALQFAASSRGMKVEIVSGIDAPRVIGDGDELTQLFQNLIDNAIKYGREGSRVAIELAPDRMEIDLPAKAIDAVRITVRDQGEGIPSEHLQRLTERFYRVDTARSREMGGTGLGLAIVKHIIGRHRGQLSIKSELGEGSAFSVLLPRAEADTNDADDALGSAKSSDMGVRP